LFLTRLTRVCKFSVSDSGIVIVVGRVAGTMADVKYRDLLKQLKADGRTREQIVERMRTAIALHIEGLRADGDPLPEPVTSAEFVAA